MHRSTKGILFFLSCLFCNFSSFAQMYIPDRDFGSCGTSHIAFGLNGTPELKLTHVLPNKKILSGGNFFLSGTDSILMLVVQYLSDGRLDTASFGTNGMLI